MVLILSLDTSESKEIMGYIYIIQYIYFVFVTNKNNRYKTLTSYLKPSFVIVTYVCLYFGFGCLYLESGYGLFQEMVSIYNRVEYFKLINIFFILCNYIVFTIGIILERKYFSSVKNLKINLQFHGLAIGTVIISAIIFLFFSLVELNLSFLGGVGSFSYIPKLVASLFLFLYLSFEKVKFRLFYYFLILIIFTLASYESKREIIFILISVFFIENLFNPIKFNLSTRTIFIGCSAFGGFIFFILVSSIARGYGGYTDDVLKAVEYIPDYVKSDLFIDALGDNFELNVVYGNALNATEMYFQDDQETLYGETFLKTLFIPIPKSVFDYKPESMINIYSPRVPISSNKYVTFPVLVYVELLWNFGILFFVALVIIILLLDNLFHKMIGRFFSKGFIFATVINLVVYTTYVQFIRGSGLDLLALYVLVSIPFVLVLVKFNDMLILKNK